MQPWDTRPLIPLTYSIKSFQSHDGERFIATGWNEYHGVYLVAPTFPNARYSRNEALDELRRVAEEHHCRLASCLDLPDQQVAFVLGDPKAPAPTVLQALYRWLHEYMKAHVFVSKYDGRRYEVRERTETKVSYALYPALAGSRWVSSHPETFDRDFLPFTDEELNL